MTKKKVSEDKQMITIDGEDYAFDDLTDLQKYMLEQVMDLKGRIKTARMHLDQLKVASAEFGRTLSESMKGNNDEAA